MQLMEIEATQLNKSQSSGQFDARPRSVEVTQEYRANIEIQTDESFLRNCKSAADIGSFVPRKIREKTLRPVDSKEAIEELINDEEQMAHLVSLLINGGASFRWSFGPLSAWGSIVSTTILTTHPSLV